jgi:hypothetical protein
MGARVLFTEKYQEPEVDCWFCIVPKLRKCGNLYPLPHMSLENKQYCSAAFLDISQLFDIVWHTGLLYKLRWSPPLNYFLITKSYLHSKRFFVKVETEYSELSSVNAGVPQAVS